MEKLHTFKYVVRTCICDVIEIDKNFEVFWCDKCSFDKGDAFILLEILEEAYKTLTSGTPLKEAKRIEFGKYAFDKAHIMIYKTGEVIIYDGKSGEIHLKSPDELNLMIDSLDLELNKNINEGC